MPVLNQYFPTEIDETSKLEKPSAAIVFGFVISLITAGISLTLAPIYFSEEDSSASFSGLNFESPENLALSMDQSLPNLIYASILTGALPSLVINESIVLQGGMDDDSVRDLLWSTLMSHALTTEEALELTTNSLLSITMNAMDSLSGSRILRPTVGDFSHVGVYQQYLLSLYMK